MELPKDFDEIYSLYLQEFGPCPYIGLDTEQLYDLYIQMKQALAGERGAIVEQEFYGDLDDEQTI